MPGDPPHSADDPQAATDHHSLELLAESMQRRGVRRIHVHSWRDLDDSDGGGSEIHADEFMRRWARVGFDVLYRTREAPGFSQTATRHGYRIVRRGNRYTVFPRSIASEMLHRMGPRDALVEIWNGVPYFSPLWFRGPNITFMHHVHGPMWDQMFSPMVATAGKVLEARIAPKFYRRTEMVTPSNATRDELLALGLHPSRVTAVDNGGDPFWSPGGAKHPRPLVVAVGRLAPVKRFGLMVEAAAVARRIVPDLELVVIGEGPERVGLEAWIKANDAHDWVTIAGRLSNEDLRDHYRRAWVAASSSLAEGWGLTLTEAAACGTPAVATNISGHRCSVVDGVTGVLAAGTAPGIGGALADLLRDDARRQRMADAAVARAKTFTWESSALGILQVLDRTIRH